MSAAQLQFMLVLRKMNCQHVFMASVSRHDLQSVQAHMVNVRGRRDFRIQTVTADQAVQALLDLDAGVHCAVCKVDDPT
jgi:hypothetical protein